MKKTNLLLTLFISVCCAFLFAGCTSGGSVKSINIANNDEAITVQLGQFNYDDYVVVVNYSNGKTEEISLTEDMVDTYEKLKFYQVGEQTIKITYKNRSCDMKVNVVRTSLNDIIHFNDKTVVYTGQPITMEVEGDVPADVTVRYPNGNSRTDIGTYTITALCYGDNYQTTELTATLKIVSAIYDMSNIKFESASFDYDGNPKSISITGKLPEGVKVDYRIGERNTNSATNAGIYTVIASFSSTNSNYKSIDDMSATLTINKAKYCDFNVNFNDKNVVYNSHSYSIEADLTQVPRGVETYYSIKKIKNAKGEAVTSEEKLNKNTATDAGTYIVRINFIVADSSNYDSIAPKEATLVIDRAEYVIDEAFMDSQYYVYDGTPKSIALTGNDVGTQPVLPAGVTVTYSYRQIKDENGNEVDGAISVGNSATDAGTYEISAHLTSTNANYKEIDDITGNLEIAKAEYKNVYTLMNNMTVQYDGNSHSIVVNYSNLPETITIKYSIKMTITKDGLAIDNPMESEGNSAIEAGTYEITVVFEDSNKNYVEIPSLTATLVITEA